MCAMLTLLGRVTTYATTGTWHAFLDRMGQQPSPLLPTGDLRVELILRGRLNGASRTTRRLWDQLCQHRASCEAVESLGLSPPGIATDPTRGTSPPLRGRPLPTPAARGCPRVACAPQRIRQVSLPPVRSSGRSRPRLAFCGYRQQLAGSKRPPPTGCRSSPRARHQQRHRRPPATWRAPSNTRRSARTDRVQLESKHGAQAATKRYRT